VNVSPEKRPIPHFCLAFLQQRNLHYSSVRKDAKESQYDSCQRKVKSYISDRDNTSWHNLDIIITQHVLIDDIFIIFAKHGKYCGICD